jgi:hypothetical protein
MATSYVDLYVNQGADWVSLFSIVDDNDTAIDLDGYQVRAKFAKHPAAATKYNFVSDIASPASAGVITLRLNADDTDLIKPGRYLYDVETSYNFNGQVTVERVIEGTLYLEASITK